MTVFEPFSAVQLPELGRGDMLRLSAELFVGGPVLRRKLQHWRPCICPFERLLCHVPAGASVLDVGCGCGLFLGLLALAGRKPLALGFDVSREAIDMAADMARAVARRVSDASLEFRRLDVADPWPPGPFDVVAMIDVMHHVAPVGQREFFAETARRVAPGGRLIYKDMCRRPRWRAVANRMHDLVIARQWISYAPIETIEQWAREEHLRLNHSERIDMLWYGHELRVFDKPATPPQRRSLDDEVRAQVVFERQSAKTKGGQE